MSATPELGKPPEPDDARKWTSSVFGAPQEYRGFTRYAWGVLGYTLFVILFGAWVRISGSGAGCGDHWPTCQGEIIPQSPGMKTVIEFSHRLTSGVLGPLVIGLVVWAFVGAGKRKAVRIAAATNFVFVVFESLLGAGLVLKELVADNDSVARAVVVALHLGNTLILVAAAALTAWFGAGRCWGRVNERAASAALASAAHSGDAVLPAGFLYGAFAALVLMVLTCMSGAVTALGDTLFPVTPTLDGTYLAHLRDDLSAGAHFLVRLRVIHPVLAIFGAGALLLLGSRLQDASQGVLARLCSGLKLLVYVQLAVGTLNIVLGAPGFMQLLHLLLAQSVWIVLVLIATSIAWTRREARLSRT